MKPVIKWSGSKRSQAPYIADQMPEYDTYYEPFVGGGSMLYTAEPKRAVCGDICKPLIDLWKMIQNDPDRLAEGYEERWNGLQKEGHVYYYDIRRRFNEGHDPCDLLFLTRTCTNGLIRFNQKGEFNNSFHITRKGMNPDSMREILLDWSVRVKDVRFVHADYRESTKDAKEDDFVYLDPPYQGTKGMYYGKIDYDAFFRWLGELNDKGVKWILSFDGSREDREYGTEIPKELYRQHTLIPSGLSTFRKTQSGKSDMVYESLYLNY